ncbi:MAG: 2,3-bisphosphoglycerate-independent phosphoglycerate mutase [Gammaproteobacteria bacterium]|nr:2,3-bisphosphoglycerate-independent phosphoglycerate mutase [Gammaproteobacteria bacterium]
MNEERKNPRRPVLLVILDGFGINPSHINNAVAEANTPRLDHYLSHYPHTTLQASGKAVGLPDGQMGNSEVGHLALGCGSIIRQDIVNIDDAISKGQFFENQALCAAIDTARSVGRPIHLMGLISDGGVHSHINHAYALIELCAQRGVKPILHMITDGRDTPPQSALKYLPDLEATLLRAGGSVATVSGRYYSMDRDTRWDRIELAWSAMVRGEGRKAKSLREAIDIAYAEGETDEFIKPTILSGALPITIQDTAIFFNFRKDRPRQLVKALTKKEFTDFERGDYLPITVTCMTEYDKWFKLPFAFEHERPRITLGEIISQSGLKQFHCAETEKYAHVTYFFNGGRGDPYQGENRVIIDSPDVATYDLAPEMNAAAVADAVIDAVKSKQYAFIVVNFANGDMVGHTAIREAVIQSVESLDKEVGRVLDAAIAEGFSVVLTADHGNCEEMVDPVSGEPHTQHTVYPVPCLVIDEVPWQLSIGAGLTSIAPTVLQLMGLQQPDLMQGQSLLLKPLSE